jgi:hypothetical protein
MQPNSQYDFMLNPDPRNSGPIYKGDKKRLALGILFVLVAIIIVIVIASIIFAPDNSGNERLARIEGRQTEIDRVITLGQKNITDSELKKQLGTFQSVVLSDMRQISDLLGARDFTPQKGTIGSFKDSKSDSALTSALQTDTHDSELLDIVEDLTDGYYSELTEARTNAVSNRERGLLDRAINNVETVFARN